MQFSKTSIAAAVLVASATAANVYVDRNDISNTLLNYLQTESVSYANSSLFIGEVSHQLYSEQYIVGDGISGTYFTSYHQVPTGGQEMYIYPNETAAVGFTTPHAGYVSPAGSTISNLEFNGPNGTLAYKGENKFIGCQPTAALQNMHTYQIYWDGAGSGSTDKDCIPVSITKVVVC